MPANITCGNRYCFLSVSLAANSIGVALTLLADCGLSLEPERPRAVLGRRAELARRLEDSLIFGLKVHCASSSSSWLRFSSAYLQAQRDAAMQPTSVTGHVRRLSDWQQKGPEVAHPVCGALEPSGRVRFLDAKALLFVNLDIESCPDTTGHRAYGF